MDELGGERIDFITRGRATIGVQQLTSDPHIETFDDPVLSGLTQEVLTVVERARARWKGRGKGPDGPLILWQAPCSEVYYFAVQNFGGKTGDYTLTITSVAPAEADDHGDGQESATNIRLGRLVSGNIDHDFDYDHFSFNVRKGEEYFFDFYWESPGLPCADLYQEDGSKVSDWTNHCDICTPSELGRGTSTQWVAPRNGKYYLSFHGFLERVGDYEFEIAG